MGQKVNPTGFRTGITEDWKSRWYAPKAAYGDFLVEDYKLRTLIDKKLNRRPPFAGISDILIERTREEVTVTLKTARPGLVIGPGSTRAVATNRVLREGTSCSLALATAERITFSIMPVARCLANRSCVIASSTSRPRTRSMISRAFRGAIRAYRWEAL